MSVGYQSLRQLGEHLGLTKSSVHRHLHAQNRRNQHPESAFWEAPEGSEWLRHLFFAALYQFGLKNGIGAGALSEFFRLIRIDTHIGISESTLHRQLREMEALLKTYQQQCEASAVVPTPERTVAMDETFFQQMMILVMMDLSSNYILLEKPAADRSFETWQALTSVRLLELGLTVRHAVSDRAKALIKLALKEFNCAAGADLFHELYDLSRWISGSLARSTRSAATYRDEAQCHLIKAEAQQGNRWNPRLVGQLQAQLAYAEQQLKSCIDAQEKQREHRKAISHCIHPFHLTSGKVQREQAILATLKQEADGLAKLAEARGIKDSKDKLGKFRRQHEALSQHVSTWWKWVNLQLVGADTDRATRNWVKKRLLPVVYWHHQKTKNSSKNDRQLYDAAWKQAVAAYDADHFTQNQSPQAVEHWQQWCEDKVTHFQRASSAVEGRNGGLAQIYHNRRGLTESRLAALTVIHNYGTYRKDGSTPANRLYQQEFPNVFEWLLAEMGALPLPRKRSQKKKANPLIYQDCPALDG